MNAQEVSKLVQDQIGDDWGTTNYHGVNLRRSLVTPERISIIERSIRNGKVQDRLVDAWLVLVEKPDAESGYRIVLNDAGTMFGLASEGFPNDEHFVLCGWYGDFMSTFQRM